LEVLSPSGVELSPFTWMGMMHQLTSYSTPDNVNGFSYQFYQEVAYSVSFLKQPCGFKGLEVVS